MPTIKMNLRNAWVFLDGEQTINQEYGPEVQPETPENKGYSPSEKIDVGKITELWKDL